MAILRGIGIGLLLFLTVVALVIFILTVSQCHADTRETHQSFSQKTNIPLKADYNYMLGTWREVRSGTEDFTATYRANGTADWVSTIGFNSWYGIWWVDRYGDLRTISTNWVDANSDCPYFTEHEKVTTLNRDLCESRKTTRWRINP